MGRLRLAAIIAWAGLSLAGCATQEPRVTSIAEARALSDRGLAQLNAGDPEGAVTSLNAVIAFGSAEDRDYARRAAALGALEQYSKALQDTDQALTLAPNEWRTHLQRAILNQKLGRIEAALVDLDNAIELEPEGRELLRRRGYLSLVAGRFAEAAAIYNRLGRVDPRSSTAPLGRGVAYYLAGDWRSAAAAFGGVLADEPRDEVAALWYVKATLRVPLPIAWDEIAAGAGPQAEWKMVDALLADRSAEEVTTLVAGLGAPQEGGFPVSACERALFLGEWRVIRIAGEGARHEFETAQRICPEDSIEGAEARAELARLQAVAP